jgi:hypothetical protein
MKLAELKVGMTWDEWNEDSKEMRLNNVIGVSF